MSSKNTISLFIQNANNKKIIEGRVNFSEQENNSRSWSLHFNCSELKNIEIINVDLFECLIDLRKKLEEYNYRPLCNGARIDVYPSGMCRDMGDGLVAYVLKYGQEAKLEDLVGIFDYAEAELISSIEEQRNFYKNWLRSNNKGDISQLKLFVKNKDEQIIEGTLFQYLLDDCCKVRLVLLFAPDIECIGSNFFECLLNLRKELYKIGCHALCNGARVDTYIFKNTVDVLRGNKVYVLNNNKIPDRDDSLFIFDIAEENLITSIEEQRFFYESWLKSISSIPFSKYGVYGKAFFPELYFRLVRIGDLSLMWLFDIDPTVYSNIDNDKNRFEFKKEQERLRAISPLSPEQVEQQEGLNPEAILGFITGEIVSLDYFTPNKLFKDFLQKVIALEAAKDLEFQAAATKQKEGLLPIVDNRVAHLHRDEISSGDIMGSFEIIESRIIANSYKPNEDYLIFGNNGLMQLPASLHEALIEALVSLPN